MQTERSAAKGGICAAAVFFAGLLMLGTKIALSWLIPVFAEKVLSHWVLAQWEAMLLEICFYFLLFLPSALFLMIFFRLSPVGMYFEKPGVPRLPYLYIPMVLGLLYAFNFVVGLILGDVFAPFDPVPSAADYPNDPAGIAMYFVYAALCPAIIEEWLFRGLALRGLLPYGKGLAVVASSLFFGFMHGAPSQTLFATVFGLIAGYTYLKTGSLWFGMLLHFVNNAISVGVTYWTVVFEDQSETASLFYGGYVMLCMLAAFISLGFYIASVKKQKKKITAEPEIGLSRKQQIKAILFNPMLYLMIAGYVFLIWLDYSAGGAV